MEEWHTVPSRSWEIAVQALPGLGADADADADADAPEPVAAAGGEVQVRVFPFLSEQGSRGERAQRPDPRVLAVPGVFERLFPGVAVTPVEPLAPGSELAFQGSDLERFLRHAWPHLRPVNVLVTHRNFLANEVLRPASEKSPGRIPNAAVVELRVRDPEGKEKLLFFVRHCTSHHNASGRGSGSMTTCADVSALRRLLPRLLPGRDGGLLPRRFLSHDDDLLIGSSVLPRAVLSAIALQRPVSSAALERVRRAFDPAAAPASAEEVEAYQAAHACRAQEDRGGAYCSAANGTFIMPP